MTKDAAGVVPTFEVAVPGPRPIDETRSVMDVKTSESHPLHVDLLDNIPYRGRFGLTLAPGKRGPSYYGGYWDRDLEKDLTVLRSDVGTDVLVTLMEQDEMATAGIPGLLLRAEEYGLRVIHFTIRDTYAPAAGQAQEFNDLLDRILDELRDEATVVVHCRGGLGRAGLVAACLLIRMGSSADEAMAPVREARPDAIETSAQEQYIRAFTGGGGSGDAILLQACESPVGGSA